MAQQASRKGCHVPFPMLSESQGTDDVWLCKDDENLKNYGNQVVWCDEVEWESEWAVPVSQEMDSWTFAWGLLLWLWTMLLRVDAAKRRGVFVHGNVQNWAPIHSVLKI